jgi:ABC-type amino acid transport substrate-binding protein
VIAVPARALQDNVLHFRGDRNYPPYEFLDKDGNPTGFNVELLIKVCQTMGLECRITLGPWEEVRSQLESGAVHGITGMFYSTERDRHVDFTAHHNIVSHTIFVPAASSITGINDLIDASIGVQQGDIMHDYVLQHGLSSTVFSYSDQENVLKSLAENKVDCALIARLQGAYYLKQMGIRTIKPVGEPILPRKYCFAVREGDDVLRSQLNEGLKILEETGEYAAIHDRWFSPYTREDIRKQIIIILLWILVPVGFILTAVFLWTSVLKRQVREKTRSLHNELAKRRQIETALVESEDNYRRVFYNAATCMILVSGEGTVLMANHKCLQAFGYDREDTLQGVNLTTLIANPELDEMIQKCLAGGGSFSSGRPASAPPGERPGMWSSPWVRSREKTAASSPSSTSRPSSRPKRNANDWKRNSLTPERWRPWAPWQEGSPMISTIFCKRSPGISISSSNRSAGIPRRRNMFMMPNTA